MRRSPFRPQTLAFALLVALLLAVALQTAPASGRHLALVKSDPVNGAMLSTPPKEVHLWFSQRPNLKLTRVVLTGPKSDTIETEKPKPADTTGKRISVEVESKPGPGKYVVSWRTLSRDGHAVAGKFTFTIDPLAKATSTAAASRKPR